MRQGRSGITQSCRLVCVTLATALVVLGIQIGVAPAQSSATNQLTMADAPCTNDTNTDVPIAQQGVIRCIAGVWVNTRSKIKASCFSYAPSLVLDAIYGEHECGSTGRGAEFIAQSRAIARLNMDSGLPSLTGINAGIQPRTCTSSPSRPVGASHSWTMEHARAATMGCSGNS